MTSYKKDTSKSAGKEPSPQEINMLVALFKQGRYAEIETLARVMTVRFPLHGFGWKAMGTVLLQQGRNEEALASLQKAAELSQGDAQLHNNLGNTLAKLERLSEAEASYRQALKLNPGFVEAHHNLGNTLLKLGQLSEAEASHRRALALNPSFAEAHNNLGSALLKLGRLSEAEASYRHALELKPGYAEAHSNLGDVLRDLGRLDAAVGSYRQALQIRPDAIETYIKLGNILGKLERLAEAESTFRRALEIKPDFVAAHNNLGIILDGLDQLDGAVACYRRALELKPDYAEAHGNLGNALRSLMQFDDAAASYRQMLALKPADAEAHSGLGSVLKDLGQFDDAVASYRRALEINPNLVAAQSNLLFCLDYHPDQSAEEIYRAYQEHDLRHGIPLHSAWRNHSNTPSPNRRLRVGYVSPDFRYHVCHLYVEPLLSHHDKTQVEVYAYAELTKEDHVTARYKNYVEHWIPTKGMSHEALAERIRSDGIDILVDLAGHTANNRLPVFSRKPAPVSLSWIIGSGYTTGLSAIDYLLADEALIPVGSEGLFTEQPWRIATPAYCYRPNEGMGEVNALPAQQRGYITFGVLTQSIRINHRTIRVWSELLKAVPNARLIIDRTSYKDPAMQERLASSFAEHGIARNRLEIGYRYNYPWEALREIDISLDCFPSNTGTSLLVSLYMGVPFITLAGRPSLGRLGSSNLLGAGHPEWIAESEEEYLAKAVELARDLDRLAAYRVSLRAEMERSPLLDEGGFARKVEEAYRSMWTKWCNQQHGQPF